MSPQRTRAFWHHTSHSHLSSSTRRLTQHGGTSCSTGRESASQRSARPTENYASHGSAGPARRPRGRERCACALGASRPVALCTAPKMAAVLQQVLERAELAKLSKPVQGKLERFLADQQSEIDGLRARHERFKVDSGESRGRECGRRAAVGPGRRGGPGRGAARRCPALPCPARGLLGGVAAVLSSQPRLWPEAGPRQRLRGSGGEVPSDRNVGTGGCSARRLPGPAGCPGPGPAGLNWPLPRSSAAGTACCEETTRSRFSGKPRTALKLPSERT